MMPIHIFSADGYAKLAAFGKRVVFYNSDTEHRDGEIVDMFSSMSSDEGTIFFSRDARILRYVINRVEQFWDLSSGRMLTEDDPLLEAYGARIYATIIPAHKEESIWVAGRIGKIKAELASDSRLNIINAQDNRLLITLLRVGEREWITTTPDGRFDTNKTLDKIDGLHWVVNEEILKPVPLEAFMRQYYEPGLLQRVLKCNEKNNCDKEFKPLPAIARINRVQPQVAVPRTTP